MTMRSSCWFVFGASTSRCSSTCPNCMSLAGQNGDTEGPCTDITTGNAQHWNSKYCMGFFNFINF